MKLSGHNKKWNLNVVHLQCVLVLQLNQEVFVVNETSSEWWYGVCGNRVGYFPPKNVQSAEIAFKVHACIDYDLGVTPSPQSPQHRILYETLSCISSKHR